MIVKPAGKKFNMEYFKAAQKHNEDGYSLTWYEGDRVQVFKTFDFSKFMGLASTMKDHTCISHMRYATTGDKTFSNIHPFDTPTGVMAHNGTIASLGSTVKSDSQEMAELLSECDYNSVEDVKPLIENIIGSTLNKLVFMEDNGRVTIINEQLGMVEDGIWYSGDYHKKNEGWCRGECIQKKEPKMEILEMKKSSHSEKTELVFVYGTLKRGYGNNRLLEDATYLGTAKTQETWAMIGKNASFPYLLEESEKGFHISGEVYAVDDGEISRLDNLEGFPYHYIKQQILVNYTDDLSPEWVTVYTKTHFDKEYIGKHQLIAEWIGAA